MSTPGTGGLPAQRLDQQRSLPAPSTAPGGAAGTVRARVVIVSGGTGTFGVFVYSGAPGAGNLIASLAGPGTTADPFGNAVQGGGLTVYGTGGQSIFLGPVGGISELEFRTGSGFEGVAANIAAGTSESGGAEVMDFLMSGPKSNVAGGTDWVQVGLVSGSRDGDATTNAAGFLNYIDVSGGVHTQAFWNEDGLTIQEGSINGIIPATGTLTNAVTAGNPPSGGGVASASTVAGSLLSYFDALATDFNNNAAAVNDLVNLLVSWGV
jgi:hypothetical protein